MGGERRGRGGSERITFYHSEEEEDNQLRHSRTPSGDHVM